MTAWVASPEVTITLPDDGKVSGAFTATFSGDWVSARTDGAHVNDNNQALTYRGADYLIHIGVKRVDGEWIAQTEYAPHVTRRENWSDAPPSYTAAIVAAVVESVAAVADVSPEIVRQGHYAAAVQAIRLDTSRLERIEEQRAALSKEAAGIRRELKAHTATMESTAQQSICRHCGRHIILTPDAGWIDPQATGDDSTWREGCDSHDTFEMTHEPS